MEDDEILTSNRAPPVEYKSYGRVPVELFEHPPASFKDKNAKSVALTASHDLHQDWWVGIPNVEISKPGRLRLTASDLKPSESDFNKYLQEQANEHSAVECRSQERSTLIGFEDSTSLAHGAFSARTSETKRSRFEDFWPTLQSPTRQIYGGLPFASPSRRWDMHTTDQAMVTSYENNAGNSPRPQSELDSILEDQQSTLKGRVGVVGSPLWKRRADSSRRATFTEFSRRVLKRAASENLRRRVVPCSPILRRVADPHLPLTNDESGRSPIALDLVRGGPDGSSAIAGENSGEFQDRTDAQSSILTVPSGYPCAGHPVFLLNGEAALAKGSDGKFVAGTPVTILDICDSCADGWTRDLHLAIARKPEYSQAISLALKPTTQEGMQAQNGSQYPSSTPGGFESSLPNQPDAPIHAKGKADETRLMCSHDLGLMMSMQIQHGSTAISSNLLSVNSVKRDESDQYLQQASSSKNSALYGNGRRLYSTLGRKRRSGEATEMGRPLDPEAKPYIKIPTQSTQSLTAATYGIDRDREGPPYNPQVVVRALDKPMNWKQLRVYQARSTDHSDQAPTSGAHAQPHLAVPPCNTTMTSSSTPAPVWTQQAHPYSWRSRLASGQLVLVITQDAHNLLTLLDPVTYSLPYAVRSK